jgi:hypothetical protein
MNNIEDFSISLPITTAARNIAQRFASQREHLSLALSNYTHKNQAYH